jgi:hypothetical protein
MMNLGQLRVLISAPPPPSETEAQANGYRYMAMGIEEALKRDGRGVSFDKPTALNMSRALWDVADILDRHG